MRIIQEDKLSNIEWVNKQIDQLTLIGEKRMVVVCHGQLYRQRMIRVFHKRVRAINFEMGQLVIKHIFFTRMSIKENWYRISKDLTWFARYYLEAP